MRLLHVFLTRPSEFQNDQFWQNENKEQDVKNKEDIPHEVLNKIRDKSITHNIFRIQDNESILCGFYCNTFIEYMLARSTLLDYTNLVSPNDYKKNEKIICKYFKDKYVKSRVEILKNG